MKLKINQSDTKDQNYPEGRYIEKVRSLWVGKGQGMF